LTTGRDSAGGPGSKNRVGPIRSCVRGDGKFHSAHPASLPVICKSYQESKNVLTNRCPKPAGFGLDSPHPLGCACGVPRRADIRVLQNALGDGKVVHRSSRRCLRQEQLRSNSQPFSRGSRADIIIRPRTVQEPLVTGLKDSSPKIERPKPTLGRRVVIVCESVVCSRTVARPSQPRRSGSAASLPLSPAPSDVL